MGKPRKEAPLFLEGAYTDIKVLFEGVEFKVELKQIVPTKWLDNVVTGGWFEVVFDVNGVSWCGKQMKVIIGPKPNSENTTPPAFNPPYIEGGT